jgi:hypothetical protein
MATDKDYRDLGLTTKGIKNARRIDEWLELIIDEVTEMDTESDPWDVNDFIARCVRAAALSDVRTRAHWAKVDRVKAHLAEEGW